MSIEEKKRLVAAFNGYFEHSDVEAILSSMTDDATWWVNGKPELFPITGTLSKAEFGKINHDIHASLNGGMKMDVVGMVAEGDQVAAELHAHALTKAGKTYDNRYHMLYTIRDGKIAAGREYTDLMTIQHVFDGPLAEPDQNDAETSPQTAPQPYSAPGNATVFEGNKRIVADFLGCFERADIPAALDMMTEDSTWWVNGNPELYPDAGTRTKAEMADAWPQMYELLDGTLAMIPLAMVAEGDQVAVEARSRATTKTGKVYDNGYHLLFALRDGKIASVREYTDLLHAAAVFS